MWKLVVVVAALLLAGCGRVDVKNEESTVEMQQSVSTTCQSEESVAGTSDEHDLMIVSRIEISEHGGIDGRDNKLSIYQADGYNVLAETTKRSEESIVYHISDEDYHKIIEFDFTPYAGKVPDNDRIADCIYYDTVVVYDDGTELKSGVYMMELWDELRRIMNEYDTIDDTTNSSSIESIGE